MKSCDLMDTEGRGLAPILDGMHIHPALSGFVERAFPSLMPGERYDRVMGENRL